MCTGVYRCIFTTQLNDELTAVVNSHMYIRHSSNIKLNDEITAVYLPRFEYTAEC